MSVLNELNTHYALDQYAVDFYQKNRYIKLKQVFSKEVLDHYGSSIDKAVDRLNKNARPMEQRDTYGKAFLQLFNLWREDEQVKEFIFSKRLAKIAASLMEVEGVRMYHDQALYKEAHGGITPWHADQYYWPLDNDRTITAWIPLQAVPKNMGPLEFSAGSHQIQEGRDLAISDHSEERIENRLRVTDFKHIIEPFDLGEVSFHSGWVFHRAGANTTDEMRRVMTVIYMDKETRLKKPENEGQQNDSETWCPGVSVDTVIDSPLNPILYP